MPRAPNPLREWSSVLAEGVRRIIASITDRWVALAMIALVGLLGSIYLVRLPANELGQVSIGPLIDHLGRTASSSIVSSLGWILLGLAITVYLAVNRVQHARIKAQGDELTQHRDREDPRRLSAGDEDALSKYGNEARERFPVPPGKGPKQ
jgi:hypothetical protein